MISARRLVYAWTFAVFFVALAVGMGILEGAPSPLWSLMAIAFAVYAVAITAQGQRRGVVRDLVPLDFAVPSIAATSATTAVLLAVAVRQGAYAWLLSISGA